MATWRMGFSVLFAVGCGSTTEPSSTADAGTTAPPVADAAAGARDASPLPSDAGVDAAVLEDASPGWSPKALPNLALWLEGDTGLSATQVWSDQSGKGNDVAPLPGTSVSAAKRPGALNGHAVIDFSEDGALQRDHAGLVTIPKNAPMTGDFLVMGVCMAVTTGNTQLFLSTPLVNGRPVSLSQGHAPFGSRAFLGVNASTFEGHVLGAGMGAFLYPAPGFFADIRPHVIGLRRTATGFALYDDQNIAVHSPEVPGDVGGELVVGGPVQGYIAELVLSAGPTTDAELTSLQSYLKTKYAISF